ncbi:hypothetical protein [Luteimonas aquatica]|uniref:hypothetical protein n=1 Tax=Luteimonas aquatica TaxID=450364 RepID=UPI001F567A98|nr:hypothetical protein [Luteimonas aquatica]
MRRSPVLLAALAALPALAASGPAVQPPPGSYGFDWLHPGSARCTLIGPALSVSFRSCVHSPEGGFTGEKVSAYTCSVNDQIEYQIFAGRDACQAQLEAMRANGP